MPKENKLSCFCGGPAIVLKTWPGRGSWWAVGCLHCHAWVHGYASADEAVQAWREEVVRRGREAREGY